MNENRGRSEGFFQLLKGGTTGVSETPQATFGVRQVKEVTMLE